MANKTTTFGGVFYNLSIHPEIENFLPVGKCIQGIFII